MKHKKYIVITPEDIEEFHTIEQARGFIVDSIFDDIEGYHPDLTMCKIFELKEVLDYDVIDKKSNYKYDYDDDIPEGSDEEAWPYDNAFEEIWKHKFVPVEEPPKDGLITN